MDRGLSRFCVAARRSMNGTVPFRRSSKSSNGTPLSRWGERPSLAARAGRDQRQGADHRQQAVFPSAGHPSPRGHAMKTRPAPFSRIHSGCHGHFARAAAQWALAPAPVAPSARTAGAEGNGRHFGRAWRAAGLVDARGTVLPRKRYGRHVRGRQIHRNRHRRNMRQHPYRPDDPNNRQVFTPPTRRTATVLHVPWVPRPSCPCNCT